MFPSWRQVQEEFRFNLLDLKMCRWQLELVESSPKAVLTQNQGFSHPDHYKWMHLCTDHCFKTCFDYEFHWCTFQFWFILITLIHCVVRRKVGCSGILTVVKKYAITEFFLFQTAAHSQTALYSTDIFSPTGFILSEASSQLAEMSIDIWAVCG